MIINFPPQVGESEIDTKGSDEPGGDGYYDIEDKGCYAKYGVATGLIDLSQVGHCVDQHRKGCYDEENGYGVKQPRGEDLPAGYGFSMFCHYT